MAGIWDDDSSSTTTDTQDDTELLFDDTPDLAPTGLVVQQHRDTSQIAELAQVAQALGQRDMRALHAEFERIGKRLGRELNAQGGSRAFYHWTQRGGVVEGPSIALMNALAGVYGRIISTVHVIEFDEHTRRALLRARVVDLLTLRCEEVDHPCSIPKPPAKFADGADQEQRWLTMMLRSQGSRGKRNALEQVIPADLLAVAMRAAKGAHAALVLGGATFEQVRDKALRTLANGDQRITLEVLQAWLGVHHTDWTLDELGALKVLHTDLQQGRRSVTEVLAVARENGTPAPRDGGGAASQPAPEPQTPEDDLGVGVSGAADETSKGSGWTGIFTRKRFRSEIGELRAKVTALDSEGVKRAREASGVKALRETTPIEKFEAFRDALAAELERLERPADAPEPNEDDGVVDPRNIPLPGDKEAFVGNVVMMEEALGAETVAEVFVEACEAWGIEEPDAKDLFDLPANQLSDYARRLFKLGWE